MLELGQPKADLSILDVSQFVQAVVRQWRTIAGADIVDPCTCGHKWLYS
jgi:hypothetical protein